MTRLLPVPAVLGLAVGVTAATPAFAQSVPQLERSGTCTSCAMSGWAISDPSPDVVSGNGTWPGGSWIVSDVTGGPTQGSVMQMMLSGGSVREGVQTTITGLTAGQQYDVSVDYQSVTMTLSGNTYRNGTFVMIVGGTRYSYATASGDSWRTATVRFTATGSTHSLGLTIGSLGNGTYGGGVVADNARVARACTPRTFYRDGDSDTWGGATTVSACTAPSGYVARGGDCDDSDRFTYPGAFEIIGDGKDENCDGKETCYVDADGDDWRTSDTVESSDPDCDDAGEALVSTKATDCDDTDRFTYPGATEVIGDEKDQSCDGKEICYADLDDDGWRTTGTVVSSDADCVDSGEAKATDPTFDCDDTDEDTYPGAPEVAYDGKDQDCDGQDLCDVDEDGYDAGIGSCRGTDCDDDVDAINPGADEIWYDGQDQDCDGWSDYDADYDGYDSEDYGGDDCDDTAYAVNPGADETWYDGIDQDCDTLSDYDADKDGHDSAEYGGEDCDDFDDTVYPGAPELDDGIDNDCNGVNEDDDSDGDGVTDEDELDLGTDPFDPDTDGDGLSDGDEVGDPDDPTDTDEDGVIDVLDEDDDGDGLPTRDELGDDGPIDTDDDGTPDHLDLDSDDDGFTDEEEGLVDTDHDGTPDFRDLDSDGDTVLDADELHADTDEDGRDDRVDTDDDGDGWSTVEEESWPNPDIDDDGLDNYLDPDADGDDTLDADEGTGDLDCDGVPNVQDSDDGDGPCATPQQFTYQSGACAGANSLAAPGGLAGLGLGLFLLVGLRRRR